MTAGGWICLAFGGALASAMAWIVLYYFDGRRRDRVEAPKYRMLEEDADR